MTPFSRPAGLLVLPLCAFFQSVAGQASLTITSPSGVVVSPSYDVDVQELITASISVNADAPLIVGQQTKVQGSESLAYSYTWTFSGGSIANSTQTDGENSSSIQGTFSQGGNQTVSVRVTVSGTANYSWDDPDDDLGPQTSSLEVNGTEEFSVQVTVAQPQGYTIAAQCLSAAVGQPIALNSQLTDQSGQTSPYVCDWVLLSNNIMASFDEPATSVSSTSVSAPNSGTVDVAIQDAQGNTLHSVTLTFVDVNAVSVGESELYAGGILNDLGGHQTYVTATVSPPASGVTVYFKIQDGAPGYRLQPSLSAGPQTSGTAQASATTDSNGEARVCFTTSDMGGTVSIAADTATPDQLSPTVSVFQGLVDTVIYVY